MRFKPTSILKRIKIQLNCKKLKIHKKKKTNRIKLEPDKGNTSKIKLKDANFNEIQ